MVLLFIEHERIYGPTGIGTITSLTTDTIYGLVFGNDPTQISCRKVSPALPLY